MGHQLFFFLNQACVTILALMVMPYALTHPSPSSSPRPTLKPSGNTEQVLGPTNLDGDEAWQEGSSTHRIGFLFGFFPPIPRPFPPPPPPKPARPLPPRLPHKPAVSRPPVSPINHLNEGHLDSLEFQFDFSPPDFFESSGFPRPEEDYFDGPAHHSPHPEESPASHSPAHHHDGPDALSHPHQEDPHHSPPVHHKMPPHSPPPHSHHEESRPPPPQHPHHPPPSHPPPPPHHPSPPRRPQSRPIPNSIYRYQVPVKEVSNPRDHIHDDLDPGGYKGLGNADLEFIKDITNEYISSSSSSSSTSSFTSFSL